MRHAMSLNQGAHVVRLGARTEHHPAALKHETLDAGTRQRQIVRDRQNDQKDRVGVDAANARGSFGIVSVVVVRAWNELRDACGSAGQLKNRGIRRVNLNRGEGRRRQSGRSGNHVRKR